MALSPPIVRIELSESVQRLSESYAQNRQAYAEQHGLRAKGTGSLENNILGAYGESALALYLGISPERPWQWEADRKLGCDIAGYEVRTSRKPYGLGLHKGNTGIYVHVVGRHAPVMYLTGWITGDEAFSLPDLKPVTVNGFTFYSVPLHRLHPMGELPMTPVAKYLYGARLNSAA
jgi:hypothetical protein